jgi:hypothetical protein
MGGGAQLFQLPGEFMKEIRPWKIKHNSIEAIAINPLEINLSRRISYLTYLRIFPLKNLFT